MGDWRGRLIWRLRAVVRPPLTLGVRTILHDTRGRILLVRHTYMGGWHLPGGAVDPGETARQAAARETLEETGVTPAAELTLRGLYLNESLGRRDHVALYVALDHPEVDPAALTPRALEIADTMLAPLDALPGELTAATRRRIDEVFFGAPRGELW